VPSDRFACPTDNDGFPECMGDGGTCGAGGVCDRLAVTPDPAPEEPAIYTTGR
jgi:hypothetical protein